MDILFKKLFAQILFWLMQLMDGIMDFFNILCGIKNVGTNKDGSGGTDIITYFLSQNGIVKAFLIIFAISILVLAASIIVGIVKTALQMNKIEKTQGQVIAKGFMSLVAPLAMVVVLFLGIAFANTTLQMINMGVQAVGADTERTLGQQVFDTCLEQQYEYEWVPVYEKDENGEYKLDENGVKIPVYEVDSNGNPTSVIKKEKKIRVDPSTGEPILRESAWKDDYSVEDIKFGQTSVDDVFGIHDTNFLGWEKNGDDNYTSWPWLINSFDGFNMLVAYIAVILLIVALLGSMLGLVKRLFDIVYLFWSLPLMTATMPLDDGARFKAWRETVVSKIVLAYGAVLSVNVFYLMLGPIQRLNIGDNSFVNQIFRLVLIIGGGLSISGGQLLFARLMGTSAEEGREMAQSARTLLGGMGTAIAGAGMAKRAIFGGTNKYGKHTTGAMSIAGRGANVMGSLALGNAYRKPVATMANAKDAVVGAGGFLANTRSQNKSFAGGRQNASGGMQQPTMQQAAVQESGPSSKLNTFANNFMANGGLIGSAGMFVKNTMSKVNPKNFIDSARGGKMLSEIGRASCRERV